MYGMLCNTMGGKEAITGCHSIGLRALPTNCDTNTSVVGGFGVIPVINLRFE